MTIGDAIKDFLIYEKSKKSEADLEDYVWTMELFDDYLANYSDVTKTKPDPNFSEVLVTGEITEIYEKHINEFLNVFLIKKVCANSDELQIYLKIITDFFNWIIRNNLIDNKTGGKILNTVKEAADLPKTAILSELLFNLAQNNIKFEPEEKISGYFEIKSISNNNLCLKNINNKKKYSLSVTKDISRFSKTGFILHLEIGLINNEWQIIESGNVYLKMID